MIFIVLLGSIGLQEVAGAGNCTEGFELAENGKCKFTAYPTGYQSGLKLLIDKIIV